MKTAFLTGANVGQSNLLAKSLVESGWPACCPARPPTCRPAAT